MKDGCHSTALVGKTDLGTGQKAESKNSIHISGLAL